MCNRYTPPSLAAIDAEWGGPDGFLPPPRPWSETVFPRAAGPFIRRARADAGYSRELVVGQWGLIPRFAKEARLAYSTNNARSEELQSKASYKEPWLRAQRCIIPAEHFDEPNWESGHNVWWRFRRTDGRPWALAGLWNIWTDARSGEQHESYTMLTVNADAHPLMRRMHKPDPRRPADAQDKRSVVPIAPADVDAWLAGPAREVAALLRLAPAQAFAAQALAAPP